MCIDGLVVDLFAGGGGASTGLAWALGRDPDIAINHDAEALALHAANHPRTRHLQNDITRVLPLEATGGRDMPHECIGQFHPPTSRVMLLVRVD